MPVPLIVLPGIETEAGGVVGLPEPVLVGDGLVGGAVGVGDWVGVDVAVGDVLGVGVELGFVAGVDVGDAVAAGLTADVPGEGQRAVLLGRADVDVLGPVDEATAIRAADPVPVVCRHCDEVVGLGDAVPRVVVVPLPAGLLAPVVRVPAPPLPAGVPLPSVLPPPDDWPPVSTFVLTCSIAWRNGGTASAMAAMNATPASTATGRSQLAPVSHAAGLSRGRGTERERGHDSEPGQAQCPRQTQVRARVAAPMITLSSHG